MCSFYTLKSIQQSQVNSGFGYPLIDRLFVHIFYKCQHCSRNGHHLISQVKYPKHRLCKINNSCNFKNIEKSYKDQV